MSQCVLKKVDPIDKTKYSKIVSANDQYQIPFFSTYRESNSYSGTEWMTVKSSEIDGKTVHYINQKTPPPKPKGDATDRYNWIFVPHLWNFYDGINPFVSKGVLDVYVLNKSNNEFTKVDVNTYNTDKSYSVHDDGNDDSHVISDSVEIPDAVKDLIAKKERLYVNFKWNDKPETFCGIYDFQNTIWNWIPVTDNAGNEDFDSSSYVFDSTVVPTTNDDEICKAMEDFATYVKSGLQPSSKTIVVAVTNPHLSTMVLTPNPDPTTVASVPNPTVASVPNPTVASVPNPTVASVTNPTVASVPKLDPVQMPQFGSTNEIYIKVIFDGIVPKTVDVVQESTVTTLTDIEKYIDGLSNGTIQFDGTPVYFKLEKSYAENIVKMIS